MARQWTSNGDLIDWGDVTVFDPPNETEGSWAYWIRIDDWTNSDAYGNGWLKGASFRPCVRDPFGSGTANLLAVGIQGDTAAYVAGDDYTWTEDVWHFVAYTFDGATNFVEMFASLEGAGSLTVAGSDTLPAIGGYINNTVFPMYNFGNGFDTTEDLRCTLAHLGMFSSVLSEAQFIEYRDCPSDFTTDRVFYAPIDGSSPEVDEDGSVTGTVTGTTVVDSPDLCVVEGVALAWAAV